MNKLILIGLCISLILISGCSNKPIKIALYSDECNVRQYLAHTENVEKVYCEEGVTLTEGQHQDENVFWYRNCEDEPKYCYIYSK